ncbi:MAG: DMT family transporter [Planctomycetes bacterium]|nr:DMT family transporter [Planctomycetota bacterium]
MSTADAARLHQNAQGIATILASVLTMAFADAVVKLVSAEMTLWQVFVVRSLVAVPLLAVLLYARRIGLLPRAPGWALLRSALLVCAWIAYYAALPVLTLSVAAVAVYTNPIITTLLSAALIREPVGRRQWAGVLLGFLGAVTVLRPGTEAFNGYTLLPMLSAVLYSVAMVLTRSRCRGETAFVLALSLHAGFLVTGLVATVAIALLGASAETTALAPFLLGGWGPMGAREWGLMVLTGVLAAGYFVGVARAYQIAAPSVIATFDYGYLVAAALWGFVLFAERPDLPTVAGMILIGAAGVLVARPAAPRVTPATVRAA